MIANVQRTIPEEHPAFAGHFPGSPILPGAVLLAEMIAWIEEELRCAVVGCASVKFLSPVRPGDVCEFRACARGEELDAECRVAATSAMRATLSVAPRGAGLRCDGARDPEIR